MVQQNYERVVLDTSQGMIYCVPSNGGNEPEPNEPTNLVTVTIDGISKRLDSNKTMIENGYQELYSTSGYSYWNDSCSDYSVKYEYPIDGEEYYTFCTYQPDNVTVSIDNVAIIVDANKTWQQNGYEQLYSINNYTDTSDSADIYAINVADEQPTGGEDYYTTCAYQPNNVTVWIDGTSTVVDSNISLYENGYKIIYQVTNCSPYDDTSSTPSEWNKYSTELVSVYIDDDSADFSPYYTFSDQGQGSIVGYKNCGWYEADSTKTFPNEGKYYYTLTPTVNVYIDGETVSLINCEDETFADQGYSTIYALGNYEANRNETSCPASESKWTTSYVQVTVNGEAKKVSPYYPFDEQELETIYEIGNYEDNVGTNYPTSGNNYSTEYILVIIDGSETNVSVHYTFAEQRYDTMYYKNDGESCVGEAPADSYEYLTACIEVSIDGNYVYVNPNKSFSEQGYDSIYYNPGSGWTSITSENPSEGYDYYTYEPTED